MTGSPWQPFWLKASDPRAIHGDIGFPTLSLARCDGGRSFIGNLTTRCQSQAHTPPRGFRTGWCAGAGMEPTRCPDLARMGRVVICTIHQPRSEIFQMFGKVLVLSSGRLAYAGEASQAHGHFRSLGFPCPAGCNIADFMLDVVAISGTLHRSARHSRTRISSTI